MKTAQKIPTVKEFLGNLELGFDFLQTAGDQLCKMKADDFDVFDRILEQCDYITRDMLDTLLLIGRKEIHPRIMLLPKHVYSKVCGLPYEEQEKICSAPIPIPPGFMSAGDGRPHGTFTKSAKDLSAAESRRVWGGHNKITYGPMSPLMELRVENETPLIPAGATNRKPQIITLDENGVAVVQFRKKLKP